MGIECHACVSAVNDRQDMGEPRRGFQIVVGTPKDVFSMVIRRTLKTDHIKTFCLDEADSMFSLGFKFQIYEIFKFLPQSAQVVLLSATMPVEVLEVTGNFMQEPISRILAKGNELTLEGIKQFYIAVEKEEWKLDTLCDLCETVTVPWTIIFCNTRQRVDWLTEEMRQREFTVSAMVCSLGCPRKLRWLILICI